MKKSRSNNLNPAAGALFERRVQKLFKNKFNIELEKQFTLELGVGKKSRPHKFDLGSLNEKVVIECKFYTWTVVGNLPSAKLKFLNEVMFFFTLVPNDFRKILFMRKHLHRGKSLAQYYVDKNDHLIPKGVEVWEISNGIGFKIY